MSRDLIFLVLGLGGGAVYAILGLGLVLEYRSSGVVNVAHGAMAMVVAYAFVELRTNGDLVLPLLGLPSRVHLADNGLSLGPALLISLGYALTLGLLVYLLVFRALRRSGTLARVVASVGLMITLQAIAVLQFGTVPQSTGPVLPDSPVVLDGISLPADRLYLAAITVGVALAVAAVYRWTRFGLATRAAAENEQGAVLLGYSTDRIAAVNWIMGTVLAGLAGILIVPITSLDPNRYTLFVVPALAVALIARFTSFVVTAAAGLALGMLESEITRLSGTVPWFPTHGVGEGIPFVVIVIAMVLVGRAIPARGSLVEQRHPRAGRPQTLWLTAGGGTIAGGVALLLLSGGYRAALIQSTIAAIICLSFVVVTGYVGQISLAQMAFAGVGGFAVSKLAGDAGIPFPLALLLGGLVAAPAGVLMGLPALRIRGPHLAVVTLAAAVAIDELVFSQTALTGGYAGSTVPPPRLFGLDLGIKGSDPGSYPRPVFGFLCLTTLVLTGLGVARLRRGPLGRHMLAVRANERAAAAIGVNVAGTKLLSFAIGAFIAGIAGGLLGYQDGQLSAESFGVFTSLGYLALAYIGGIARISGAITVALLIAPGGLIAVALDRWLGLGPYDLLISGVGLIVTVIAQPDGIAAAIEDGPISNLRARLGRGDPGAALQRG